MEIPGERGSHVVEVDGGTRIGREQLEERGELRAAADVGDDERRTVVALRVHDDRRGAEHTIETRFGAADLADVLQRDLGGARARRAHEPKVRQEIVLARQMGMEPLGTTAPQQPFPGQRRVHDFEKLTLGTCFASGGAWNRGYSLKPNSFAVRFEGNCRRDTLYFCTASL